MRSDWRSPRRPTLFEVTQNVRLIGELGAFSPGLKSLRENLERSPDFGGSPLLQQRGATLQRCGKESDFDYAL
jgi:hypothetical protein